MEVHFYIRIYGYFIEIEGLDARQTENVTTHVTVFVHRSGEGLVIDEKCRCLAEVAVGTITHKFTIVHSYVHVVFIKA